MEIDLRFFFSVVASLVDVIDCVGELKVGLVDVGVGEESGVLIRGVCGAEELSNRNCCITLL